MELLIVMTSIDNEKKANKLAKRMVRDKLACCVSISSPVCSHYVWQDKMEQQCEYLMLIKTIPDNLDILKAFLQDNHPYKIPEIISFRAEDCNRAYLDWAMKQISVVS
ncbi:MAG: divalent cation tolerance protein CutA [Neisseriaceae bacterium]|nr:MAG: divalent cation tolerance protein CutA [Neisseriaceae bacterium]